MESSDIATAAVITGYEVFRFGVPMIGEYDNAGRGRTVTISSAVPGAQYRITAWALDSGTRRSATPAVRSATIGDVSELNENKIPHVHTSYYMASNNTYRFVDTL